MGVAADIALTSISVTQDKARAGPGLGELPTAEVRVLQVGNGQITRYMYRQLEEQFER